MDCVNCGHPCDGTSEFCSCSCADEFYRFATPRPAKVGMPALTIEEEAALEQETQREAMAELRYSRVGLLDSGYAWDEE